MAYTFRDFAFQVYRLINASNPTIPLHGDDEKLCLQVSNQLLQSYAGNGLMLTIAQTVTAPINLPVKEIIFTDPSYPAPTDPSIVQIAQGRLANLDNAWLILSGVTYPLIDKSRDDFLAAWKYEPLQGLPRFIITFPETQIVRAQLYPAPSQFFDFYARGKFQLSELTKDSDMTSLPQYYVRYLLFATARDVCMYKGRAEAWTPKLEQMYQEAYDIMVSTSEVNLSITGDEQSLLNGAWRVKSGI